MFPFVAAWDRSGWNSPNSGKCIKVNNNKDNYRSIYIISIDQCGGGMGRDSHYELSMEAFTELFGDLGSQDGHGYASWQAVEAGNCKGNLGSFINF